jgi:cytochrome c-type biogenesis protein CcmE
MRLRWVVLALACAGVVVWMLVVLRDNVVFLEPVSEAVAARRGRGDESFRMGGSVVPGTIDADGGVVRFRLTEGGAVADVRFSGTPPQLFADCAPVVAKGRWDGDVFVSEELLIRHDEEYEPPEGAASDQCPERA